MIYPAPSSHPLLKEGDTPPSPSICGGSDVILRSYITQDAACGVLKTTTMSQPVGRRRSLRIVESRRKILRDTIREIVSDYKRAQRRQRWRDAIWDIIQQKWAKQQRLKRMVRKMAVCLCYYCPSELYLQRLFHIRGVPERLKFPKKVLNSTIRMWCCQARVHMACILQSMYSLYGRANKHDWRCVHCRRHLMDSRDEDIFHIGINDIDSFDSEDDEEIEHVHRIDESHIPDSDSGIASD